MIKKQPTGLLFILPAVGSKQHCPGKEKPGWIDLDAQTATTDDLFDPILRTANGQQTQNERHGYREIAIFKDGIAL